MINGLEVLPITGVLIALWRARPIAGFPKGRLCAHIEKMKGEKRT
jgi:hypothetical protein